MKKIVIVLLAILMLAGCTSASPAQEIVDAYLTAIKNGTDTSAYKISNVDDFINMIEFKFLSVESSREVDYVTNVNSRTFELFDHKFYATLADAINGYKKTYGDKAVVSESPAELVIKTDVMHESTLVYDVTHTNALGQKLYGKFKFVVRQKPHSEAYEVVRWSK